MKLSVIIVNYNVKYFLEQCLHSVREACKHVEAEIYVVDNNSVDGSIEMVREKFPEVQLIANKDNRGFSRANNQAIRISTGEYVLLLNPDTVVEQDTFIKVTDFMDAHPDAGGLGVKMVDGKGHFLPESKRGLPTPAVAFYKIAGLARLFPHSKRFGRYHLGYLSNEEVNEIEILSGAFMLMRREALDRSGLLDEDFFMYGEDIDLSYRLILAGYKNYYYPHTRIIHYKGESTKKSSVNYVFTFYNAMVIFARKHFSQKHANLFSFIINIAIWLRAGLAIVNRFIKKAALPLIDALIIFAGMYFFKNYWEQNFIYLKGGTYPLTFIALAVPLYIAAWITSVFISGGYDKPYRINKLLQGMATGTVLILVVYALLSEQYRFSRALILLGAGWGFAALTGVRLFMRAIGRNSFIPYEATKRYLVIGNQDEAQRVTEMLRKTTGTTGFIGLASVEDHATLPEGYIGSLRQIKDIITIYHINEVIFCAKDLPAHHIIDTMTTLNNAQVEYKIAPPESLFIIGSSSISTTSDLYVIDVNPLSNKQNQRNKRLADILFSLLFFISWPLIFWRIKSPLGLLRNIFFVLTGKRSWVGFSTTRQSNHHLPSIRKGVLTSADNFAGHDLDEDTRNRLNLLYARDYKLMNDIHLIFRRFSSLGRL